MKVLANPVLFLAIVVFCFATFAFFMGLLFMRLLLKT